MTANAAVPRWRRARWALLAALMSVSCAATNAAGTSGAATATEPALRVGVQTQTLPSPSVPTTVVSTAPPALPGVDVVVEEIIDGDTINVGYDENVRMLGYDTPERDECGFTEASDALRTILASGTVTALRDGRDTDRYGRYLRHVYVDGVPVGLTLIEQGWANARYDSLDGYARHIHQDEYRGVDGPHSCGPAADQ